MLSRTLLAGLLVLTLVAGGCSDDDQGAGLTVVATTTILGDVVSNVVGNDAAVVVLMPAGADPHDFRASAAQVARINDADLVVANGLGLEEGLIDVLEAAESDGVRVLEVADALDPLPFGASAREHDGEEGHDEHDHGGLDPHVWLDPLRVADAARLIAEVLAEVSPGVDWDARAEAYASDLAAADAEIFEILAAVPDDRRILVTNHDALGYFADRYGFEVAATVIPGGSTVAEPSSEALADLVRLIDEEGVDAIFADTTVSVDLAAAIAVEAGRDVAVVELFTGSLGESGSDVATLVDLLITNATRIAAALDG